MCDMFFIMISNFSDLNLIMLFIVYYENYIVYYEKITKF